MRRLLTIALLFATTLLSTACAPGATYSPASSRTYPKKADNCFLQVFSTPPQKPYDELGTFDIHVGGWETHQIESVSALREALGPQACRLGADALIAFTYNGLSVYTRAVAIHWTAQPEAPPPAPAEDAEPSASE